MSCASADETRVRLVNILGESFHCALDLKKILVEERQALEQSDTVSLNSAASSKLTLVNKIADLNQARGTVSAEAGFGSDPDNIDALAEWCDKDSALTDAWQGLQDIATECDRMNRTNGAIIYLRRQQIMDGLSVLRGDENGSSTYAPTGSASRPVSSRAITEA